MLDLVSVLLSWILALTAWLPIGYWILKISGLDIGKNPLQSLILAGVSGAALTSSILALLSLLLPLNVFIAVAVAIIGLVLFGKSFFSAIKELVKALKSISILSWIGFGVILLISIYASILPSLNNDSGLYYIQFMKWIQSYPAVPGLANLHERFGFNSNWHLLNAAYDLSTVGAQTTNDLNGLLFVLFGIGIFGTAATETKTSIWLFAGLSLFILLRFLTSTAPDLPATLIPFVYLTHLVSEKEKSSLPLLILLIAFAATVKLLSAIHIAAIIPVLYWTVKRGDAKALALSVIAGLVVSLPWFARNVVQTGYLVFPLESIDLFSFDWKVPAQLSENARDMVTTHARMGTYDLSTLSLETSQWFPTWLIVQSKTVLGFFGVALLGSLLLILDGAVSMIRTKSNPEKIIQFFVALTLLCSVAFWWKSGPNPRFIYGIVLFSFTYILYFFAGKIDLPKVWKLLPFVSLLPLLMMTRTVSSEAPPMQPSNFKSFNVSGVSVSYPENSDKCWDKELPCSNQKRDEFEFRGKTLGDGFKPVD